MGRIDKALKYIGIGMRQLTFELEYPEVAEAFSKISEATRLLANAKVLYYSSTGGDIGHAKKNQE